MTRRFPRSLHTVRALALIGLGVLAVLPAARAQDAEKSRAARQQRRARLMERMRERGGLPPGLAAAPQAEILTGAARRYYTGGAGAATIPADSLKLAQMGGGSQARLYPKMDRVREAVASDRALAAFLASPEVEAEMRAALDSMTLYIALPRPGDSGFNEFNALSAPAGDGRGAALMRRLQGAQAGNPFAGPNDSKSAKKPRKGQNPPANGAAMESEPEIGPENPAPAQRPGLLGDLKTRPRQPNPAPAPGANPLRELARARMEAGRGLPRDFSAFVSLSPDGERATLYVLGSVPARANAEAPINFTVEARAHGPENAESLAGAAPMQTSTLLDKQSLTRGEGKGEFFCFAYPLAAPPPGGQSDLMVSFWLTPSNALTHGIALARAEKPSPGASPWIAIPMTRTQRFQKDYRYNAVTNAEPGQPIAPLARKK